MALGLTRPLNRNVYQEYFLGGKGGRCVWLSTLPPSCADCQEIWEPQPPGTLRACIGIILPSVICLYLPPPFWVPYVCQVQNPGNVAMLPVHLIPSTISGQCPAVDCSQLNVVTVCLRHKHTRYRQWCIVSTPTAFPRQASDTTISTLTSQLEESEQFSSVNSVTK